MITPIQETILKHFAQAPDSQHFYLTGGTALAYFYLKHRASNDLDFFTSVPELVNPFSHQLEAVLKNQGMSLERRRGTHSFVELQVGWRDQTTVIRLAQDAAFRFEPPKEFPDYPGLKVDSLKDIASNKLLALYGRATLRDFIDIHILVRQAGFTQEGLMEQAEAKDPGFDPYWLGIALERIHTFQENSPEMLMLLKPVPFQELLFFFGEWRKKIAEKLKS